MSSISLNSICGATLLSRALKLWEQLGTGLASSIAPLTAAFQGGAMAAVAMVPVTTDHYPIRLGPSCRPPV